jgi:hypothetical protein
MSVANPVPNKVAINLVLPELRPDPDRSVREPQGWGIMKRIIVIAAGLLTLASVSVATATVSSASVCQPNGNGCTQAGTYPGPNAVINSDYGGFNVVWTESVVQPYSSGVPLYWTAYATFTNTTSSDLYLACPGSGSTTDSIISENMSGGSGDDGTVLAGTSNCDQNPGLTVTVPPGGSYADWGTFHNVPWPGSAVAITWGDIGTSPYVYPFGSPSPPSPSPSQSGEACVFNAPDGVTPTGLIGHVGWGFELPNGNWEFGANEGPGNLFISETWAETGSQHAMLAIFTNGGPYHSAGYYTSLECVTVPAFNASAAKQEVKNEWHQRYIPIFQDCESQVYKVLSAYGVNALPNDILHPIPNSWYNDLTTIGGFGPPTSL